MLKKVFAVLAAVFVVIVALNLTVARLPGMPASEGQFISLRGKDIHYVERPGNGPLVLMIHGLPGTVHDFDPVVEKLPGAHIVAVDRPGFGWSRGGWLPFAEQVDVMHDLIDRFGGGSAMVVGHSYGGAVALGLAERYPRDVESLVLIAPAAGGLRQDTMSLLQARYVKFSLLPVIRPIVATTFGNLALRASAYFGLQEAFAPQPVPSEYEQRLLAVSLSPGNRAAYADDVLESDRVMQSIDSDIPRVTAPTVIVAAQQDRLVPIEHSRALHDQLAGSKLIEVEGSHMIPDTHPDVVAAQVVAGTATRP